MWGKSSTRGIDFELWLFWETKSGLWSIKKSSLMKTDRTLTLKLCACTKPSWSVITAQMSGVFLSFIFILFSLPDGLSFVSVLYSCVKPYQWSHFSRQMQACHGQSFWFYFKSGYFKANSLILKTAFIFFNPYNSHSIPFFFNLLSKDKNEVMLRCSPQDWRQFNGNPSPGVCALKDMIQAVPALSYPLWCLMAALI